MLTPDDYFAQSEDYERLAGLMAKGPHQQRCLQLAATCRELAAEMIVGSERPEASALSREGVE